VSDSDEAGPGHSLPLVAITMGDPAGIGPEIIVKALSDPAVAEICRTVVIGDAGRLERAAAACDVRLKIVRITEPEQARGAAGTADCVDLDLVPRDLPFGQLSEIGGETAYQAVRRAAALAVEHRVDAICTAPLNKEALHLAGHHYPGHTEMLADLTGTDEVSMMLVSPRVRVIHVTTHIGLIDMVERIEPGLVHRTIKRGHEALVRAGLRNPRIAVCGINPHAGEHGLFGRGEEETKVAPGVERARADGIDAQGPLPADTVFFRAGRGDFDLVVAMYHDQGHGPVKVLGLEAGVNITVGLPVIRTSVDHGTAFDIAGTGKADHLSLVEALRQAAQLASARD
jgi:4-hydroxythreonine-4-phosphate dehydrogenase